MLLLPCCAQSCPTLCGLMDCGLLGSSIHGILQARILEWVAISYSSDIARLLYIYIYIYIVCTYVCVCVCVCIYIYIYIVIS